MQNHSVSVEQILAIHGRKCVENELMAQTIAQQAARIAELEAQKNDADKLKAVK